MQQRRRSPSHSFEDQLATEKERPNGQLANEPRGPARDVLVKKISEIETASHINEWPSSPGLQPPRR